jgi:hypothetical protein
MDYTSVTKKDLGGSKRRNEEETDDDVEKCNKITVF